MAIKGKSVFTKKEAELIRDLIRLKLRAGKDEQKRIRGQIRDIGFYYSDYSSSKRGYTVDDFNGLISSNLIRIIG